MPHVPQCARRVHKRNGRVRVRLLPPLCWRLPPAAPPLRLIPVASVSIRIRGHSPSAQPALSPFVRLVKDSEAHSCLVNRVPVLSRKDTPPLGRSVARRPEDGCGRPVDGVRVELEQLVLDTGELGVQDRLVVLAVVGRGLCSGPSRGGSRRWGRGVSCSGHGVGIVAGDEL